MGQIPPVVRALLLHHGVTSVQPIAPGMSGAVVFRCESSQGQNYALKRWPQATKASRVREIHRVQQTALQNGCVIVPRLFANQEKQTFIAAGDSIWELCSWLSGSPLSAQASIEHIRSAAASIAEFHMAVRPLGQSSGPAPAVTNRLSRLNELSNLLPQAWSRELNVQFQLPLRDSLNRAGVLLQSHWQKIQQEINLRLGKYASGQVSLQYVLRDVHREHILFHDSQVSGLIDFDAVRIDTIATDLARWGGSFMAGLSDRHEVWHQILAGYESISSFSERLGHGEKIQLLDDLHLAGTWISIGNWAIWLRLECRTFPSDDALIVARIDELVQLSCQYL